MLVVYQKLLLIIRQAYFLKKNNIEDLSEKLKILIEDTDLRKNLGINGRNFVKNNYDWRQSINEQIKIYKKIIYAREN